MAHHDHDRPPDTAGQFATLGEQALHVVQDGAPDAPVLLLIHGLGASADWWDPVVPPLADTHRVIRVDLLGHGRSTGPAAGYGIPAQARRIGAVLDALAVQQAAVVVGHSTGGYVAMSLAEQRPGTVSALALIGTGPSPDADTSDSPLGRLLLTRVPGRLLWRLLTGTIVRRSLSSAFTRPVEIPDALVEATRRMPHHALAATARAALAYIEERAVPERLAGLRLPVLVLFGAEDRRWCSSASADAYRLVPGSRVELLPEWATPRCTRTRGRPARCSRTSQRRGPRPGRGAPAAPAPGPPAGRPGDPIHVPGEHARRNRKTPRAAGRWRLRSSPMTPSHRRMGAPSAQGEC